MFETLLSGTEHPLILALSLILISWIWEDAAVISGALLAADSTLSIPLAIVAVFLGISSGDMALYYLGGLGNRWRKVRAWILLNPQSRYLGRRFRRRTLSNILIIRFIPGLRTLGFTLCGLWRVPIQRFTLAMLVAGACWIAIVFTGIYSLGTTEWLVSSRWKWSLLALAGALLVLNNLWPRLVIKKVGN